MPCHEELGFPTEICSSSRRRRSGIYKANNGRLINGKSGCESFLLALCLCAGPVSSRRPGTFKWCPNPQGAENAGWWWWVDTWQVCWAELSGAGGKLCEWVVLILIERIGLQLTGPSAGSSTTHLTIMTIFWPSGTWALVIWENYTQLVRVPSIRLMPINQNHNVVASAHPPPPPVCFLSTPPLSLDGGDEGIACK